MSRQTDIEKLIAIYSRRLQKLRENEAFHGIDTAPGVALEIEEIEDKLKLLRHTLENESASEAVSAADIATELARLRAEAQTQNQGLNVNISGVRDSSINFGNIVTGSVKGDVVAGDKVVNGDNVVKPTTDQKHPAE